MLRSYVTYANRGRLILSREVLGQLGIGPNGFLYGAFFPPESTIVLSPIPPSSWEHAYKIIIHTHYSPGSLAKAAEAVAELKLDTISSWASTESHYGHLCSTSIVLADTDILVQHGGPDGLRDELKKRIARKLSDLPTFVEGMLEPVRVTKLSILETYAKQLIDAEFFRVNVHEHTLNLGTRESLAGPAADSLWSKLCEANDTQHISACILTPDTEEAFLRVSAIAESARLCSLSFHLTIKSEAGSFAGYWKHALDLLAARRYSVYVARNLLIEKQEKPHIEEAEFHFVVDRRSSQDSGARLQDLEQLWLARFQKSFGAVADERGDEAVVDKLRVSRPRGVGIPCFFASNAKPHDGRGSETAARLCRHLEGEGFRPVNIDLARGGESLRDQVRELVLACSIMVVLHCPEDKLKRADGKHNISEWVVFEEGLMAAKENSEIIRFRFDSVRPPVFGGGFMELELDENGLTEAKLQDFSDRLERWKVSMYQLDSDNLSSADISAHHWERDLVAYYGGK